MARERAFRTLKGVDMAVRPEFHWLDRRVKAHVLLCMLAYYVEHHMRNTLAPILFADHEPGAAEHASIVRPAQPSAAAAAKIKTRQAADGTPIMAWHDLIANLGTLTINEVALPPGGPRTIHMLARVAASSRSNRSAAASPRFRRSSCLGLRSPLRCPLNGREPRRDLSPFAVDLLSELLPGSPLLGLPRQPLFDALAGAGVLLGLAPRAGGSILTLCHLAAQGCDLFRQGCRRVGRLRRCRRTPWRGRSRACSAGMCRGTPRRP